MDKYLHGPEKGLICDHLQVKALGLLASRQQCHSPTPEKPWDPNYPAGHRILEPGLLLSPVALTTCGTKNTGNHNTALQPGTTDLQHLPKPWGDMSPGRCPESWLSTWSPYPCGVKQKSSRWEAANSKEQRAKQKTWGSERLVSQNLKSCRNRMLRKPMNKI